jgi:transcriptional regulator with XRE-family HTH domain
MSHLGYSIRILRRARGLTAAGLATKAGISRTYLSLIESGDRLPPLSTLGKLADALQVQIELLQSTPSTPRSKQIKDLVTSLRRVADAEMDLRQKLG